MKKLFLLVLLLCGIVDVSAQNYINIPDSTLERASIYNIPVYFNSDEQINEISLLIEYDFQLLDVKGIETDENTLAANISDFKYINPDGDNNAMISVSMDYSNDQNKNILCYIRLEALFGSDSIAFISVNELKINGQFAQNYDFDGSEITIAGELIYPGQKETISINYPNPFYYSTKYDINLTETTKLKFKLFDSFGKIVAEYPGEKVSSIDFILYHDGIYVDYSDGELEKGNYELILSPTNTRFASGIYYLLIESNSNIYKRKMIYQK